MEAINAVEAAGAALQAVDGQKAVADEAVAAAEAKVATAKQAQAEAAGQVNANILAFNTALDELASAVVAAKRTPLPVAAKG